MEKPLQFRKDKPQGSKASAGWSFYHKQIYHLPIHPKITVHNQVCRDQPSQSPGSRSAYLRKKSKEILFDIIRIVEQFCTDFWGERMDKSTCQGMEWNGRKPSKERADKRKNARTNTRTHIRTNECTKERTPTQTNERTNKRKNEWTSERTHERTNQRANQRANQRTNERTHSRTNQPTNQSTNKHTHERLKG